VTTASQLSVRKLKCSEHPPRDPTVNAEPPG
jgi:hypothetical protein